jgi:hypothetical protein
MHLIGETEEEEYLSNYGLCLVEIRTEKLPKALLPQSVS